MSKPRRVSQAIVINPTSLAETLASNTPIRPAATISIRTPTDPTQTGAIRAVSAI